MAAYTPADPKFPSRNISPQRSQSILARPCASPPSPSPPPPAPRWPLLLPKRAPTARVPNAERTSDNAPPIVATADTRTPASPEPASPRRWGEDGCDECLKRRDGRCAVVDGEGAGKRRVACLLVPTSCHSCLSFTLRKPQKKLIETMRAGFVQSFVETALYGSSPDDKGGGGGGVVDSPTSSTSCSCCCHCGRAVETGPKARRRSKRRSRSYSPVRTGVSELSGWDLDGVPFSAVPTVVPPTSKSYEAGNAPIERLPTEVLEHIVDHLALDIPPAECTPRNVDLVALLLASRTLSANTVRTLYTRITIPHSSIFSKFAAALARNPALGPLVKTLDLSHLNPLCAGRSRSNISAVQNLTADTLLAVLARTPTIREVLLQEHVEDELSAPLLRTLVFGLPQLQALDLCAASSHRFVHAFAEAMASASARSSTHLVAAPHEPPPPPPPPTTPFLGLQRLSLHECFTLPSATLEGLLPMLPQLTHLDLHHTRVTDAALGRIPHAARLSHLNLGRCTLLTGADVVRFLTTHPAAGGLVYLNLAADVSHHRLLWEGDLDALLPRLPRSLRSLNLGGAKVRAQHVPLLRPLTKHLEELGLAFADLDLGAIDSFFVRPDHASSSPAPPLPASPAQQPSFTRCCSSSSATAPERPWQPPALHYLDLTAVTRITPAALFRPTSVLLTPQSCPLAVVEFGEQTVAALRQSKATAKRKGWVVKELGRRGWLVREGAGEGGVGGGAAAEWGSRDGARPWKMGARWWGMRKIPVSRAEVGGLYGFYMFKK